ncbi:hypothetical protein B0H14DRAFT_2848635 [Mycena olivaceomarginata]|nr:hypothetical protein B0H14DRAFT_2848635 [Mycena olivaceomarginata]
MSNRTAMSTSQQSAPTPIVTPWRLLNFFCVLAFSIAKLVETLKDKKLRVTILDGVLAVVWGSISYWTAFIENKNLGQMGKWFFLTDASVAMLPLVLITGMITGSITIQSTEGLLYGVKVLCIAVLSCYYRRSLIQGDVGIQISDQGGRGGGGPKVG